MTNIDRPAVINMMARMKADVRKVAEGYASEASMLSVNSSDPHIPIIGCMQMALANALTDYLVTCGVTPLEAFQLTVNSSGLAMKQWVEAAAKAQGLQLKVTGPGEGNGK